jgi:hypothetical protein
MSIMVVGSTSELCFLVSINSTSKLGTPATGGALAPPSSGYNIKFLKAQLFLKKQERDSRMVLW